MGRVKRRLAKGIGVVAAWRLYRNLQQQILTRLGGNKPWRCWLAVTPDKAASGPAFWPKFAKGAWIPIDQGPGDLGIRMARPLYELPSGPVVIVGTDIPDLNEAHIEQAFAALDEHDVVFGPAHDGGYYLIGFKRRPHVINPFYGVRWSTEFTLSDTLQNLVGYRVAFLETLQDIDTIDDLIGLKD